MTRDVAPGTWSAAVGSGAVRQALATNRVVRDVRHAAAVGSTQDALRGLAIEGASTGTVLLTDVQHAGRGRSGRRWDDDPTGGNLALSLLLDTASGPLDGATIPLLPHALGLAVLDACDAIGPIASSLRLKWPNDVVVRPDPRGPARKLAGVLVERERVPRPDGPRDVLLCGIGVNVDLRGPVPADRIDLLTLLRCGPDRTALVAALLRTLDAVLCALSSPAGVLERYRSVSDTVGRRVRVDVPGEAPLAGVATGIDDDGRLLVTTAGSTRAILSGTIRDADPPRPTDREGGTGG